jgi:hypothetical protein
MKKVNYQFMNAPGKAVCLFILLLFSTLLYAQDDQPLADTLVPLVEETQPPPPRDIEEVDEEDDDDDKKSETYFLPKWTPGNNTDSPYFRKTADSVLAAMRNDADFWYANAVFKKEEEEEQRKSQSFLKTDFFQTVLWLLIIGGFIAFLIIFLANSNVNLFRKNKLMQVQESNPETDDIFAIQYDSEIEKAVNAGNYRLAVRLMFLRTLRTLSDKSIIQYEQDRTNLDYLLQVRHASWYQLFFRITRNYEYVWYGKFEIDREKFEHIKTDFTVMDRQLPTL